jgi:hypothetical protein
MIGCCQRVAWGQGWHEPSPVTGEQADPSGTWQYWAANRVLMCVQPQTNPIVKRSSAAFRNMWISCRRRRCPHRVYSSGGPLMPARFQMAAHSGNAVRHAVPAETDTEVIRGHRPQLGTIDSGG